jgi:DNA-binding response OmpR family regulator
VEGTGVKEKILVIDDHPDCREILFRYLMHMGYEPELAIRGTEGIEKAVTKVPDAIVLDLGLPDIDGIEVIDSLKRTSTTCEIPILVYSAKVDDDTFRDVMQAGAAIYLTKPTSFAILKKTLDQLIAKNGMNDRKDRITDKVFA